MLKFPRVAATDPGSIGATIRSMAAHYDGPGAATEEIVAALASTFTSQLS